MKKITYNIINNKTTKLFFDAFSNPKRFKILLILKDKSMNVLSLQQIINCEQSDLSHNLQCLLNCGFVNKEIRGKERVYSINKETKPIINSIYKHINKYGNYMASCNIISNTKLGNKNE